MDIVSLTIYRESDSEGPAGMLAVAWAIANRARSSPKQNWPCDPERVCLQPYQFSCWNTNDLGRKRYGDGDPNYSVAAAQWGQVQELAAQAAFDSDPTGGAQFYVNPDVTPDPFAGKPEYVFTVQIGKHWFYRLA